MTLDGAINLNETNDYVIYTMNSVTTGQYGVVVPKNVNGTLNMLVDLHFKGSFDGVGSGSKTKDELVSEIADEYNKLKDKYVDGMLVMPMIAEGVFKNTVLNGDKQKMFDEVKKIGAITSELYKKLTAQGIDKQKIDQKIIIVEKNQEDETFVNWLKEQSQMSNFVDGILYSSLSVAQTVVNPFADNNSIFGPAVSSVEAPKVESVVTNTQTSGGIFDNASSVVTPTPVTQSEPVAPVVTVEPVVSTPVVEAPVTEQPVNANVDLFGNPVNAQSSAVASTPVQNTVVQNTSVVEAPVVPNQQPVVEGPKPVESAMLEGTIAFTPIPNHSNNPVDTTEVSDGSVTKKSNGFVNLAILLVVLVVVTIVSIELGKYLYSVFGA